MVETAVQKAIAEQFCLGETPVNLDTSLFEYDADSLDLVELVMTIEDELKIEIPDDDFIGPDVTKMTGRQLVEIATKAKG